MAALLGLCAFVTNRLTRRAFPLAAAKTNFFMILRSMFQVFGGGFASDRGNNRSYIAFLCRCTSDASETRETNPGLCFGAVFPVYCQNLRDTVPRLGSSKIFAPATKKSWSLPKQPKGESTRRVGEQTFVFAERLLGEEPCHGRAGTGASHPASPGLPVFSLSLRGGKCRAWQVERVSFRAEWASFAHLQA